jgi:hypothetical protein
MTPSRMNVDEEREDTNASILPNLYWNARSQAVPHSRLKR